jgi:GxxExxY protein
LKKKLAQRRKGAKTSIDFGSIERRTPLNENEIARIIVDACFHIHTRLGPGLLESVYEGILEFELRKRGLLVDRQAPISVIYDGLKFDEGFQADLIVNSLVIIELKSVEKLAPVHRKQVLTYLKLTGLKLGLLINFGAPVIKDGIIRLVNGLPDA